VFRLCLSGVVKDWLLIAISWSVIKDTVTVINLLGYLLAFGGVAWYNQAKLHVSACSRSHLDPKP